MPATTKRKKPITSKKIVPKKGQPQKPYQLAAIKARFLGLRRRYQIVLILGAGLLIFAGISYSIDRLIQPVKQPRYGVSFSVKYAQELSNDWKANYTALLDDLKIQDYRLMSHWDTIEPDNNRYTFADLDWQMDEAAKRGANVSLSIGLRQPRWPECHEPGWAKQIEEESAAWRTELYEYIEAVVTRYRTHPALYSYQLENEASNNWFGDCRGGAAPQDRLVEEFNLVKQLDPYHEVWMSLGDQHGWPLSQPTPDKYGFSVYRVVYSTQLPVHFYMTYPITVWYHRMRIAIIDIIRDRDVFIHELQAEPWGPKATKDLTIDEQDRSMSSEQIHKNLTYARKIGKSEIYLWGGEWWYWRKQTHNDARPWEAIREELNIGRTVVN